MLLYAITSRQLLEGDESAKRDRLVALAKQWAEGGVDYIQVREKDLPLTELQELAARVVKAVHGAGGKTKVLVNGPAQVAIDAGADGVHFRSGLGKMGPQPAQPPGGSPGNPAIAAAERVYARSGREAVISASCHSPEEIREAAGVSLLLFSPVFEKVTEPRKGRGQGLTALRAAVELANRVPVLALGGVTEKNAAACVQAGAVGIAAIRLFLGEEWKGLGGV